MNNNKNISGSMSESFFKKGLNNNPKNSESKIKENYQEAILNKSNKTLISIIKIYILIMILLIILIIGINAYIILNNISYNRQSNMFFNDFKIITTRYNHIYYYFITLKSLFILNEKDKRWKKFLNTIENMNNIFYQSNSEYTEVLNHRQSSYKEVAKLLEFFQYNKNDSSTYIEEILCPNFESCQSYLKSPDNIFNQGIDMGFKTCFSLINNIIMDYKKLKNKTSIEEINLAITGPELYEFRRLRKSFTNIFYYLQELIFYSFENDEIKFRNNYKNNVYYSNIISLIFCILLFLFVFISVFFTINEFIRPIKDSTYRLNYSFYYIKKYNVNNIN